MTCMAIFKGDAASKLLQGGLYRDYLGDYYSGYEGGYLEFRL